MTHNRDIVDVAVFVGRLLFAAIFVTGGLGHVTKTATMAAFAEANGVRPARTLVLLSGIAMLVGAGMIVAGVWADAGALLLALVLLPTACLMHRFWRHQDPQARMLEQIHFHKDLSLAGAAIALSGLLAGSGNTFGFSLTRPLGQALFG